MPLSTQAVQSVKTILDNVTSEGKSGVPGLVFVAVDKTGQALVEHASGTRSIDRQEAIDFDTSFWIASCTKLVVSIAAMQLVEQGKLSLDDPETLKRYAPEIGQKKVYADGKTPAEQQTAVTLRMLLSHTAGFAYTFFKREAAEYAKSIGLDEIPGDERLVLDIPLFHQPGEVWEYGTNIDWVGIIIERASGLKLNDYLQTHICQPLGLSALTMFPTPSMRSNLASTHERDAQGTLHECDHIWTRPFNVHSKEEQGRVFHAGGGGLFGNPREYTKILACLLNDGTSPDANGYKLLKPETVKSLWQNQIPDKPDFARNAPPGLGPLMTDGPQGHGLGSCLTLEPGETGRGANSAWWCGLPNLYWWVDRERGVAGMLASQVLPLGDEKVVTTWQAVEKAVYDGLEG